MALQNLTEYERLRLENVKRNKQKLDALKLHSRASELSSIVKTQRPQYMSDGGSKVKKQKTEEPVVYRRSARLHGTSSEGSASGEHEITDTMRPELGWEFSIKRLHRDILSGDLDSFSMSDAYRGNGSDRKLIDLVKSFSRKSGRVDKEEEVASRDTKDRVHRTVKLDGWDLKPENVAQVIPGWITDVKVFPTTEKTLVVAGNKSGDVGFWNVDIEKETGDHTYLYNPHTEPVTGLVIEPFSMSKIFTSSEDGFIRSMDIAKEVCDSIYLGKYPVHSISGRPHDKDTICFSEGNGVFDIYDLRAGSSSSTWRLHSGRAKIHTIDFNPENTNIMATSCSNGIASIWDLRNISRDKPVPLKAINHKNGVQSAYFSPSGRFLATTSIDLTVAISSGANYEDRCSIPHLNIGKGVSAFRGIWGWDDSYVYIGNMRHGVDVISATGKKVAATFTSDNMRATPYRFDAHKCRVGMLVGASSVGEVYVWKSS